MLLVPCLALLLALPWALHRAHSKGEVYDLDELLAQFNSESVWKEISFLCLATCRKKERKTDLCSYRLIESVRVSI